MAGWDLGAGLRARRCGARMLQSFGLAFLFIPINVSAFAYVPKEKTNMGTGIINLGAEILAASVGDRDGDYAAGPAIAVSSSAADGARQRLQRGVSQHAQWNAGSIDLRGVDGSGMRARKRTE